VKQQLISLAIEIDEAKLKVKLFPEDRLYLESLVALQQSKAALDQRETLLLVAKKETRATGLERITF
jgi:hypothetical protein